MRRLWCLLGHLSFWLAWPLLWVYLRRGERSRVIVLTKDLELLVVNGWLSPNKRWDLPGGGIHRNEVVAEGACRELREETGVILEPEQLREVGQLRVRSKGFRAHLRVFVVIIGTKPFVRPQPLEIIDVGWLPFDEVKAVNVDEQVLACMQLLHQAIPDLRKQPVTYVP